MAVSDSTPFVTSVRAVPPLVVTGGTSPVIALTGGASIILTVPYGGTGASTLTGILQGNGTSAFTALSSSTVGQVLRVTGANTYALGALDLADGDAVTGNLAVTNGGTGRATSTTAYALLAAGTTATGAHQTLAAGATTEILVGGGASALPVWTTATGTGAPVRAASPTFTGTLAAASGTFSGTLGVTGDVGIGVAAASALSKLDVREPNKAFASSGNVSFFTTTDQAADTGAFLALGGYIVAGGAARGFGFIKGGKTNSSSGDTRGYLSFLTMPSGATVPVERMRISDAGAVTIPGTLGVTDVATFTAQPIMSSLTASQLVFTDASKGLVSGTDIPTATTIGTAYVYRVGGTDVAVADGGTALSTIADAAVLVTNSANTLTALTAGASQSIRRNAGNTAWEAFSPVAGTVTSVAQTFTGGLISVAGSPITSSGTLALTVAGTSGGIPYFSGATTWASSAALGATALVMGGGAGATPYTDPLLVFDGAELSVFSDSNYGIQLGANGTTTSYVDFRNNSAADYDARIASTSPTGTTGRSTLTVTAGTLSVPNAGAGQGLSASTGDYSWITSIHTGWTATSDLTNVSNIFASTGTVAASGVGGKLPLLVAAKGADFDGLASGWPQPWALGLISYQNYLDAGNPTFLNATYAMYAEVWKLASGSVNASAIAQGIEISVNNLYNGAAATTPYNDSPAGLVEGQRIYAQSSLGAATRYAASTGLMIGGESSTATFQTGLIFNQYAATGTNRAISMAEDHTINWHTSAGGATPVATLGNSSGRLTVSTGTFGVSDATDASSTTTGAVTTAGGVGIAKKLYVGTGIFLNAGANCQFRDSSQGAFSTNNTSNWWHFLGTRSAGGGALTGNYFSLIIDNVTYKVGEVA